MVYLSQSNPVSWNWWPEDPGVNAGCCLRQATSFQAEKGPSTISGSGPRTIKIGSTGCQNLNGLSVRHQFPMDREHCCLVCVVLLVQCLAWAQKGSTNDCLMAHSNFSFRSRIKGFRSEVFNISFESVSTSVIPMKVLNPTRWEYVPPVAYTVRQGETLKSSRNYSGV